MRSRLATWKPVAYHNLPRRHRFHAAIVHTNGRKMSSLNGSLYGWWSLKASQGSKIGAQFQIGKGGKIEQYVDTDFVVYHAYDASEYAVGIETQDDVTAAHPVAGPWTNAQLDSLVALLKELRCLPRILGCHGMQDGIGYHQLCDAWNQHNHNCPGPIRSAQLRNIILPALTSERDDLGWLPILTM